jgi:hypothetical protein
MGPSSIENEHGWTFTTIVVEADDAVVLCDANTRCGAMSNVRRLEPTAA